MTVVWIVLLLLITVLLISKINIRVTYYREGMDDELIIIVSALFGLVNIKNEFNLLELLQEKRPALKVRDELEAKARGKPLTEFGSIVNAENALEYIRKYMNMKEKLQATFRYIRRKVYIKKLKWHTVLGTGDAAATGILIGFLWNAKTFFSLIAGLVFKTPLVPDLSLIPCFDGAFFRTNFDCILSIRIGHAIIAGAIFLTAKKKDGDAIERASNTGIDENHNGKHQTNG